MGWFWDESTGWFWEDSSYAMLGFCGDLTERTKSHRASCSHCLDQLPLPFTDGVQAKSPPKFYSLFCSFCSRSQEKKGKKKGDILHFIHSVGARSSTDMNESSVRRLLEKQHFLRRQLQDL